MTQASTDDLYAAFANRSAKQRKQITLKFAGVLDGEITCWVRPFNARDVQDYDAGLRQGDLDAMALCIAAKCEREDGNPLFGADFKRAAKMLCEHASAPELMDAITLIGEGYYKRDNAAGNSQGTLSAD